MRAKERAISQTTIDPMLRSALTFCRRKCRRKGQLATGGRTVLCVWRRYVPCHELHSDCATPPRYRSRFTHCSLFLSLCRNNDSLWLNNGWSCKAYTWKINCRCRMFLRDRKATVTRLREANVTGGLAGKADTVIKWISALGGDSPSPLSLCIISVFDLLRTVGPVGDSRPMKTRTVKHDEKSRKMTAIAAHETLQRNTRANTQRQRCEERCWLTLTSVPYV